MTKYTKYKPSTFEVEKEWNTAESSDNKRLLEEIGSSADYSPYKWSKDYSSYEWSKLPQSLRKKISEYVENEQYILPPREGMSKEVLEPQWMQIDCERSGGTWVKGFHRDGTWVQGYCRKSHNR